MGTDYWIETTTDLGALGEWRSALRFTLTNTWQPFEWTNQGEASRFFRVVKP